MDGDFRLFAPAYAFIDGKLDAFLSAGAGRVLAEVSGPLRAALVLYVLLYGVAILRGAISEPFMDFAVRSVKLALIYLRRRPPHTASGSPTRSSTPCPTPWRMPSRGPAPVTPVRPSTASSPERPISVRRPRRPRTP